jgi:sodium/proline symporter
MSYTLLGFILYLLIILVVGIVMYYRNKSHEDFILGGRTMNPWVVAFSERASGESAWLLLGLPGLGYAAGYIGMWDAIGCVSGIILYWLVIAERLRIETEEKGSITLPDFFASKFVELQRPIRLTATLIIVLFFTYYLAAQFNGAGKVLNVTFGIENETGILIGACVIVFYTMMGGFLAVAWTDLLQGIIMIGALVILPVVGLIEIMEQHASLDAALASTGANFSDVTGGATGWLAVAVVLSGLSWGLGYMGQPHLLTRFMSINKPSNIRISRRIAFVWAIPGFAGALVIGLVGLVYYGSGAFEDVETRNASIGQRPVAPMACRHFHFRCHRGHDVNCGLSITRHHLISHRRYLPQDIWQQKCLRQKTAPFEQGPYHFNWCNRPRYFPHLK